MFLNALSKFGCQILSYKQDIVSVVRILYFVNKESFIVYVCVVRIGISFNIMLLFVVDKIIYKHIKSVYIACHKLFCQGNGNFFTVIHSLFAKDIQLNA